MKTTVGNPSDSVRAAQGETSIYTPSIDFTPRPAILVTNAEPSPKKGDVLHALKNPLVMFLIVWLSMLLIAVKEFLLN